MQQNCRQNFNHEIAERVTPLGQVREALEYYCSAIAAEERLRLAHSNLAISPVYYLLGHSIELSLKALLRQSGMHPNEYRKRHIGHDLCSCLHHAEKRCPAVFKGMSDGDRLLLELLNQQYSNKGFEYFGRGIIQVPEFDAIRIVAHNVLAIAINEIPMAMSHLRGSRSEIFQDGFTISSSSAE